MLHCKGRVDLTLSLPEVPLDQWIHTRVVFEIIADSTPLRRVSCAVCAVCVTFVCRRVVMSDVV